MGGVESNFVYYWFFPGRESARKGRVGCQESVEWHGRGGVMGGGGGEGCGIVFFYSFKKVGQS